VTARIAVIDPARYQGPRGHRVLLVVSPVHLAPTRG
jgi:hypothetical protein